jgi:hypothetical protein
MNCGFTAPFRLRSINQSNFFPIKYARYPPIIDPTSNIMNMIILFTLRSNKIDVAISVGIGIRDEKTLFRNNAIIPYI